MEIKKLWEFPVPSTYIAEGGVNLFYPGGDAWLLFDFYDEKNDDKIFNSGILFDAVQAHRHTTEKFTNFLEGSYDSLVKKIETERDKQ